jgi:hypothetical protein
MIRSKFIKTFLSVLMMLTMLTCSVLTAPVAVFAETIAPVLAAGDASGNAGDTVTVPVTLTSSGEVAGMQFDLSFDTSQLSYSNTLRGPLINVQDSETLEQVYNYYFKSSFST